MHPQRARPRHDHGNHHGHDSGVAKEGLVTSCHRGFMFSAHEWYQMQALTHPTISKKADLVPTCSNSLNKTQTLADCFSFSAASPTVLTSKWKSNLSPPDLHWAMDRQKGHRDQHAEERLGCTLQERMKKRTWPVLKHVTAYPTETCFYGLQSPPERKMFITIVASIHKRTTSNDKRTHKSKHPSVHNKRLRIPQHDSNCSIQYAWTGWGSWCSFRLVAIPETWYT